MKKIIAGIYSILGTLALLAWVGYSTYIFYNEYQKNTVGITSSVSEFSKVLNESDFTDWEALKPKLTQFWLSQTHKGLPIQSVAVLSSQRGLEYFFSPVKGPKKFQLDGEKTLAPELPPNFLLDQKLTKPLMQNTLGSLSLEVHYHWVAVSFLFDKLLFLGTLLGGFLFLTLIMVLATGQKEQKSFYTNSVDRSDFAPRPSPAANVATHEVKTPPSSETFHDESYWFEDAQDKAPEPEFSSVPPHPHQSMEEEIAYPPLIRELETEIHPYTPDEGYKEPEHFTPAQESPHSSLYALRSGLGWEHFLPDRLDAELNRAASFNQDLTLILIQCSDLPEVTELYRILGSEVLEYYGFKDLAFEYQNLGFTVIVPNQGLDKALKDAGDFIRRLVKKFPQSQFWVGVSARNGRLLDHKTLLEEATRALEKAREGQDHILGYRSNPEKWREHLRES